MGLLPDFSKIEKTFERMEQSLEGSFDDMKEVLNKILKEIEKLNENVLEMKKKAKL